ncbi:MAG: M42 family metallopeptidase [Suilimivivens sp.]
MNAADLKKDNYLSYIMEETKKLLSIDSPTGYTKEAAEYVCRSYREMGYEANLTVKGGVLVDLGGSDPKNAILLEAHVDTLGAMVAEIKENGRLKLTPLGGLNPNNAEAENCKVITRNGKKYEGTFQMENASIHVNGEYDDTRRGYEAMELVLDEKVSNREEAQNLGIMPGDIVAFEPRTRITDSGYIKSRFLDDKLSVGILLGMAKYMKEENIKPFRKIYHHITVYEEVGHGACGTVPGGVTEILSVDMGCVGKGLGCSEHQVSVCAKDSRGPYSYEVVGDLIAAARRAQVDFAVDVYPHYGSDADAALTAGYDVRHGLIGAGVYASHGYERSHIDGVHNTFALLKAYLL